MKKFFRFMLSMLVIDPLIILAVWNVLMVPMFRVTHTNFKTCIIISITANLIRLWFKGVAKSQQESYY